MLNRYHVYLAGMLLLAVFTISCGGNGTVAPDPVAPAPELTGEAPGPAGFPGLPMGELARESTIISSG